MTAFSGIESLKSFGDGISGALSFTSSNTNFTIELLTFVPNYQIKIICKTSNRYIKRNKTFKHYFHFLDNYLQYLYKYHVQFHHDLDPVLHQFVVLLVKYLLANQFQNILLNLEIECN